MHNIVILVSNMDKFGRSAASSTKSQYLESAFLLQQNKNSGLNLTAEGHYDITNKKMCNISTPEASNDAATKQYVDNTCKETMLGIVKKLDNLQVRVKNFERKTNKYYLAQTDLISEMNKIKEQIEVLTHPSI